MLRKLVLCVALVLLAGCSSGVEFSVDNPTGAAVSVTIDGTAYEVPAQAAHRVVLAPGPHVLEAPATGKVRFMVYADTDGGLINPTLGSYVTVGAVYARSDAAVSNFRPVAETIALDGVEFTGLYRHDDGLFIDKSWHFGVNEDFPDMTRSSQDKNIRRKLFRKDDFVRYLEAEGELSPGEFARRSKPAPPRWPQVEPLPARPSFRHDQLNQAMLKLWDIFQSYRLAETAREQIRLREDFHGATLALAHISAGPDVMNQTESKAYNQLIWQLSDAVRRSARILD